MSNVYTYTTEIKNREENIELMEYITEYKGLFNHIQRVVFHKIKGIYVDNQGEFTLKDKEALVKYVARTYGFTTRAANSIVYNMTGRFNAIKELKEYEREQLEIKIESLEKKIAKTEKSREDLNLKMATNIATKKEQEKYEKLKISLYWRRNKLNKKKQKLVNIENEIGTYNFKLCFGTNKLSQKDYQKFVEQRDSEIFYVGRATEKAGNMNFQMEYNKKDNQFYLQIRKEINTVPDKYVRGKVYFSKSQRKMIKKILRSKESPLTYRIKVKNGRYYLQVIFQYKHNKSMCDKTRNSYGVIGVDFNKGFVAVSETDSYGNLINTFNIKYRFRSGNKTESDFQYIAKILSDYCLEKGKDLVIENLKFDKEKANMVEGDFKIYNEMLSSLAYAKFSKIIESKCAKNRIFLKKVNPAWTSRIAKEKYCENKKLNIHSGASYVIARRGQGLKDKTK